MKTGARDRVRIRTLDQIICSRICRSKRADPDWPAPTSDVLYLMDTSTAQVKLRNVLFTLYLKLLLRDIGITNALHCMHVSKSV